VSGTSLSRHISNVLNRAERGQHVDDDDLAMIPDALHDRVRAASARLVAFHAAGDGMAARQDRFASEQEIADAALAASIDPNGAARRPRSHQSTTDVQAAVESIPRGFH
jgi:hypothetical protein